jgi:hypothetical protein
MEILFLCLFPPPLTSMAKSGQYHAPPEIMMHLHNDPFHMTNAPIVRHLEMLISTVQPIETSVLK